MRSSSVTGALRRLGVDSLTDGIIKGSGNSRYLKSVANALTLYPTHESFMEALAAGTLPVDLNGINPAGWTTQGTPLNKSTLLTDALCTALGLPTTATPTQAMDKLKTMVNQAQQDATRDARVSVGTYVGTGDSLKKKSLTLSFPPQMVIIIESYSSGNIRAAVFSVLGGISINSSYPVDISAYTSYKTGNTFYWEYPDGSASDDIMLNKTKTYYYAAIG